MEENQKCSYRNNEEAKANRRTPGKPGSPTAPVLHAFSEYLFLVIRKTLPILVPQIY